MKVLWFGVFIRVIFKEKWYRNIFLNGKDFLV